MNFISIKTNGKERLKCFAPFDKAFIENLTLTDGGLFIFDYNMNDIQTGLPENITQALFVITPTDDNLFASAILYLNGDSVYTDKLLNIYGNDFSNIDCEVIFTKEELKKLTLFLLSKVVQEKIKNIS